MKTCRLFNVIGNVLVIFLAANSTEAATRYVKTGASGTGTTSWSNASGDLQAMITASASGDEVWVASGTYSPGSSTSSTFTLKANVNVRGGYSANVSNPSERDINPVTNNCVLTGVYASGSGNVQTVVTGNSNTITNATIVEGFTITAGKRTSGSGAGISLTSSASPTIQNCRIMDNVASGSSTLGGGVAVPSHPGRAEESPLAQVPERA